MRSVDLQSDTHKNHSKLVSCVRHFTDQMDSPVHDVTALYRFTLF